MDLHSIDAGSQLRDREGYDQDPATEYAHVQEDGERRHRQEKHALQCLGFMRVGFGVEKDRFNEAFFDRIQTDALRLEVQLQPGFSSGVLEWRVNPS